jgi:diguanylate cyclase (GGDEF)-like protein/PAS domain S-box-containing protein
MTGSASNNLAALHSDSGERFAKNTLLVADDQDTITSLIEQVVKNPISCHVLVAHDGDEALERLTATPVDVFVTDMMMPGVHGLDLVTQAKQLRPDTDIIVMTGYPDEFPYVEVVRAGATDFINKPFPQAELVAKLFRLFRERRLREERIVAESKYRSLFELGTEGMLLLDGTGHTVADVNHAFCRLSGKSAEPLKGRPAAELFEGANRIRFEQWLAICGRTGGGSMSDLTMTNANTDIYVDITASFITAGFGQIVFLTFKDVTEKREIERQLAEAAQRDGLTGLFNKRSFQNRLIWALTRAKQNNTPACLLAIDLDNFKRCNDSYGHQVGDKLLVEVGNVIRRSIRSGANDEGFRCGGDEFSVILHETDKEGALIVAQRLQSEFNDIERYGASMSIGLAQFDTQDSPDTFIRKADEALYKAKAEGKNTIALAD